MYSLLVAPPSSWTVSCHDSCRDGDRQLHRVVAAMWPVHHPVPVSLLLPAVWRRERHANGTHDVSRRMRDAREQLLQDGVPVGPQRTLWQWVVGVLPMAGNMPRCSVMALILAGSVFFPQTNHHHQLLNNTVVIVDYLFQWDEWPVKTKLNTAQILQI